MAALTPKEAARALRALSSCYVERRARLQEGAALESAGKRAAFALFYGPLHFILMREILRSIPDSSAGISRIEDLGCGTGAAGAAWALEAGAHAIRGLDRSAWAVAEAGWTYRHFGLGGRALRGDVGMKPLEAVRGTAIIVAFAANELTDAGRASLLVMVQEAHARGARVLVMEPIARAALRWWPSWERAVLTAGGRADEWRFPSSLPPRQAALAKAAGLNPRELTARTLYLP